MKPRVTSFFMALLLVAATVVTAHADANFDSNFGVTVSQPAGVNLGQLFDIAIAADPSVIASKKIPPVPTATASAFLTAPTSSLSVIPFSMSLDAGVSGFAHRPDGHAEAESGGLSHTVMFTNHLATAIQPLTFSVVGFAFLIAHADPGDSADASFGVSVFLTQADGTLVSNGKGDGVFAPPNSTILEPFNFDVQTGPIPRGGSFSILIRGFAAGSATARSVPEPSTLTAVSIAFLLWGWFRTFPRARPT